MTLTDASLNEILQPLLQAARQLPDDVADHVAVPITVPTLLTDREIADLSNRGTPVASRHAKLVLSLDSFTAGHLRRLAELVPEGKPALRIVT